MKKILSLLLVLCATTIAMAQVANPVKWTHTVKGAEVHITATTDAPYHIYDMGPYDGGPTATSIKFKLPAGVKLDGRIKDLDKPKRHMDDIFGFEIGYYGAKARWIQKFSNTTGKPAKITATVEWQACDDNSCIPPQEDDFSFTIEPTSEATADAAADAATQTTDTNADTAAVASTDTAAVIAATPLEPATVVPAEESEDKSLWGNIIAAILWGLAALITPCVFPMIPMTVSFFLKGSENKAQGRFKAMFFGLSIIVLYVLPIAVLIGISYFGGGESVTADIFNWLSTHWLPNIIFFLVFMVFAASFFGAFEITMPSKLTNKADANADKGGLMGVFFMALTLVLVSFSCTGPIVGSVLVESTQGAGGDVWEPIIVMFAFAATFAIPFTIFALFPSLLKNMPKSGGWLNSVKVVLGFIEVAFGLKFLMTADQAYGWGILDREVYLALWIVVFTLLGFYLLGKLRFKHDDEVKYVSVKRLTLAIASFAFVVYMIPGMWGAPLKVLSGYMPPVATLDFNLTQMGGGGSAQSGSYLDASKIEGGKPKYSDFLHLPNGLEGFFDYKQGVEYAKAVGKPVMIDFTGHGCVNCREVEANVWSDPTVNKIMRNDYVIIALYVDDKRELPEDLWITDKNGKVQKTIGRVNAAYQIERYATNAQPYYVLIDPRTDTEMGKPLAYSTIDIASFTKFLQGGLATYKASSSQN